MKNILILKIDEKFEKLILKKIQIWKISRNRELFGGFNKGV